MNQEEENPFDGRNWEKEANAAGKRKIHFGQMLYRCHQSTLHTFLRVSTKSFAAETIRFDNGVEMSC